MNELKLEEYSLRDRPEQVYRVLRNYLKLNDPAVLNAARIEAREQGIRHEAQQRAFKEIRKKGGPLPRMTILIKSVVPSFPRIVRVSISVKPLDWKNSNTFGPSMCATLRSS
jgi:hypothetical protein